MRLPIVPALVIGVSSLAVVAQDDPVFSGPQTGERVVPFDIVAVTGAPAGQTVDLVHQAEGGPLLLIFVHERTRPAFGLMNALARFGESRADRKLTHGVAFLSADPTETETWLRRVTRHLPSQTVVGYSAEGQEGPGSWGLNRNVAMTVVVASEGKVTANFALVQPSLAQDGPRIIKAVVDITGGGEVPDIATFSQQMRSRNAAGRGTPRPDDARMRALLSPLIQKDATEQDVEAAAAKIEEHVRDHPAVRKRIAEIATRIIDAGRLEHYGTPRAQQYLKKWASAEPDDKTPRDSGR